MYQEIDRRQFLGGFIALAVAPFKVYTLNVFTNEEPDGNNAAKRLYTLPDNFQISGTAREISAAYQKMISLGILPNIKPTDAVLERLIVELYNNPKVLDTFTFDPDSSDKGTLNYTRSQKNRGQVTSTTLQFGPPQSKDGPAEPIMLTGYSTFVELTDPRKWYAHWASADSEVWQEWITGLGSDSHKEDVTLSPVVESDLTSLREIDLGRFRSRLERAVRGHTFGNNQK